MRPKGIEMDRLQELVRLHRMGTGAREVARLLQMSPNTEREYRQALATAGLLQGDPGDLPAADQLRAAVRGESPPLRPAQEVSTVEPWAEPITAMLKRGAGPKAIFDCLRLERKEEFKVSLSAVKRYVRRVTQARGVRARDVAIPVETAPGEVAQVDFGYVGPLYDPEQGRLRKAWVFVLVLGYSRHLFAQIAFDQKVQTWLQLHVEAFTALGGVPRVLVPDNLKAAVVRAAFAVDGGTALNRSYRDLARSYGFKVDPTPPRDPEKKGKVEAAVKYCKSSYFRPRQFTDVTEARSGLKPWIREVAGMRVHGTTGRRPLQVFEKEEHPHLLPLPALPPEPVVWHEARVHPDSHVQFDRRLYSAPWKHIGEKVWIRATATTVAVYRDDVRLATHPRRGESVRSTQDAHLPEHRVDYRYRSREYWVRRASALGEEVRVYIEEVFAADEVLSQLRTVQAMVTHLETFPADRARAACVRAQHFGNHRFSGLKDILRKALDLEPLPQSLFPEPTWPTRPRFARTVSELVPSRREVVDEPH